ncbi:hypothetical protein L0O99_01390 [Bilophila wadsworthia]|nr:hypothetical protein [Bilophila wadsworthia]
MKNELWNGLPVVNGIAGKGIRFERIRRSRVISSAPWTASTTPSAPK